MAGKGKQSGRRGISNTDRMGGEVARYQMSPSRQSRAKGTNGLGSNGVKQTDWRNAYMSKDSSGPTTAGLPTQEYTEGDEEEKEE